MKVRKVRNQNALSKYNLLPVLVTLFVLATVAFVVTAKSPKSANGLVSTFGDIPQPVPTQVPPPTHTVYPAVQPTQNPMGDCPANWADIQDRATRDACAKRKDVVSQQQRASEIATMEAQPQAPIGATPVAATLLPPPDYARVVEESKYNPYNDAWPFQWIGATSVWEIGAIPNNDYTAWGPLYLVAYQGNGVHSADAYGGNTDVATSDQNPTLATMTFDDPGDGASVKYSKKWVFPESAGEIYITGASIPNLDVTDPLTPFPGLRGVISFKTRDGQTGQFDLAKEIWSFDSP